MPTRPKQHAPFKRDTKRERREYDKRRGSASSRGYGHRWAKASKRYRLENPLCERCKDNGIVKASECVDHIIPAEKAPELFWCESNWSALCNSCHSIKTVKEDGGFGNERMGWGVCKL